MTSREHARRFHFLREIAAGGFGTVHLVKVMHADGFSRLVAVKLLKTQWSDTDEVARRMRDEARLLGLLRHRNIVDVIDLTSIDGRAAVVMEYLEAVDLRELVERLKAEGKRVPVRAVFEVAASVSSALDAAYNRPPMPGEKPLRVIHRDIKPSNIMLDESGLVKVLDFGVARSEIENRESHTQELQFGSVDYMAPERLFFEPETPASDVYSLAATVYEVLAQDKLGKARGRPERHRAFLESQVGGLRAQLDLDPGAWAELSELLLAALAFNHEDRPTAAEFYQRSRTLSRLLPGDDLASWSERVLPPLIRTVGQARQRTSPLDDTILLEDSKAFAHGADADLSPPRARPTAEELRRGALAELEASGNRPMAALPTGAPSTGAQPRPKAASPDPADAWDDGPTHISSVSMLSGIVDDKPLATEEAIAKTARAAAKADLPPDPADPFAAMTEMSTAQPEVAAVIPLRDRPVPLPLAPGPSPRGRKPAPPPAMPVEVAQDVGGGLPDLDLDRDATEAAPTVGEPEEAPTVLMVTDGVGGEVRPVALSKPHPADLPDEDSRTLDTPRRPSGAPPAGGVQSVTVEVSPTGDPLGAGVPDGPTATATVTAEEAATEQLGQSLDADDPSEEAPAPARRPRNPLIPALAVGCLLGVGILGVIGLAVMQKDRIMALVTAGSDGEAAPLGEAREATADDAAPAPEAPLDGPTLHFVSAAPDTAKLRVRCDAGSARGDTEAHVAAEASASCTVTAMMGDRSRLMAVVKDASAGTYRCFEGGETSCERQ